MDIVLEWIIIYFVVLWIGGVIGVRNNNGIKQKEVHIPVWLNMILFLKNDHRALFGMFAYQISLFITTILSLLGYYFRPFNNNPFIVFYHLMLVPAIVGCIYGLYIGKKDFSERRRRKKSRF